MLKQVRRIVTTNDENGKSAVLIDGIATNVITVLTELWMTKKGRADHLDGIDYGAESRALEPPSSGTVFRFFQIAPESADQDESGNRNQVEHVTPPKPIRNKCARCNHRDQQHVIAQFIKVDQ